MRGSHWQQLLSEDVLRLPRTAICFDMIETSAYLDYNLPPKHALAGHVLKHIFHFVDQQLENKKPVIYKFGFTHCPHFRFFNQKFGYQTQVEKWEGMTVLYASHEITSPAFVEAALIQRYIGASTP